VAITLNIPKNKLKDLYIHQFLSSYQIAKVFSCSQAVIMNRLREFKIPTRTIQEGKALTKPRYPRKDFDGSRHDKAYLIGFRLGDLHIRKTHPNSPTIQVHTNSTRQEQVTLMQKLFNNYGHVRVHAPDKKGAMKIRCFLNNSFAFLVPKPQRVEPWILKSKKSSLAFLAGYIDAEGSFGLSPRIQPFFSMKSQDKKIMSMIQSRILPLMKIETKLHFVRPAGSIMNGIKSNKDVFGIFLYSRQNLGKILNGVLSSLKHPKRKADAIKVFNFINNVRA
jgi:hypothetical protein